ncbi:MAG: aminomethyl transferase family protein [Acidimicrobiaceae bacterium]|nr:aminomethyl transferase family protein [Acidimicrobiaceae bacterium]MYB86691.1 aminomethyl transferase family protein [Acidimicrobiaceae bacterium]MYH92538.1 aminomethyl transferase family protein [Acidimicrobiaceae bacterium]
MTEPLSRTSALASRHTALGSGLEDWNGMGTAWEYDTDPCDEHDAIREAAGMFDMSPLKKIQVRGTDAGSAVDHLHSRDLARLGPGQSAYGAVLTDSGKVADDAIAFNNGDDGWLVVHGSGSSMELLAESAEGRDIQLALDDDLHIVSLQGPESLPLLDAHASADLSSLAYFHHLSTELFGRPVMVSRTGYSGERGYEIFATAHDVGAVWDGILAAGEVDGVMAASFTALDKVRVEAALLFYGYDMTDDHFPSEVGLGWALSRSGADYRGRQAALAAAGTERFVFAGISIDHTDMVAGGETLRLEGRDVGTVNSPAWSHRMGKSLALVHLAPDAADAGTALEVVGEDASYRATVERIPFYDSEKSRTHAP